MDFHLSSLFYGRVRENLYLYHSSSLLPCFAPWNLPAMVSTKCTYTQTIEGTDLHIVRAGRFGVDSCFGLEKLRAACLGEDESLATNLSHHQMQTIVGSIGNLTGHAVYIPMNDRPFLDWGIVERFDLATDIPSTGKYAPAASLAFIDVLWIHPTQNLLAAAFEIEYSTPIYSGLLRFNDVHIDVQTSAGRHRC